MNPAQDDLPRSIAIAGAWGYIGRKFLDVALARGLATYVYDPGPEPQDVDLSRFTRVDQRRRLLPASTLTSFIWLSTPNIVV